MKTQKNFHKYICAACGKECCPQVIDVGREPSERIEIVVSKCCEAEVLFGTTILDKQQLKYQEEYENADRRYNSKNE